MTVDINRIKQKIRALLSRNVKNGATVSEAQACLDKAYKLLDEFNIDIKELLEDTDPNTQKVIQEEVYSSGQLAPELSTMMSEIAFLFNCRLIRTRVKEAGHRYRTVKLNLVGNPINVEKCKYFYNLFNDNLIQLIKINKITGLRNINSYKRGFYLAIVETACNLRWEKEKQEEQAKKTGTSLMVIDEENVAKFIYANLGEIKTVRTNFNNYGKADDVSSLNAGREAGATMNFNDHISQNKGAITCKN